MKNFIIILLFLFSLIINVSNAQIFEFIQREDLKSKINDVNKYHRSKLILCYDSLDTNQLSMVRSIENYKFNNLKIDYYFEKISINVRGEYKSFLDKKPNSNIIFEKVLQKCPIIISMNNDFQNLRIIENFTLMDADTLLSNQLSLLSKIQSSYSDYLKGNRNPNLIYNLSYLFKENEIFDSVLVKEYFNQIDSSNISVFENLKYILDFGFSGNNSVISFNSLIYNYIKNNRIKLGKIEEQIAVDSKIFKMILDYCYQFLNSKDSINFFIAVNDLEEFQDIINYKSFDLKCKETNEIKYSFGFPFHSYKLKLDFFERYSQVEKFINVANDFSKIIWENEFELRLLCKRILMFSKDSLSLVYALHWINRAIYLNESFDNLYIKALIFYYQEEYEKASSVLWVAGSFPRCYNALDSKLEDYDSLLKLINKKIYEEIIDK